MRKTFVTVVSMLILGSAAPAVAQQSTVNVDRLPIDVQRIQRELRESATREEREGLQLRYVIDVFGQAPPLVLFGPRDNLTTGPVPYSAPTHQDMLYQMTPQEFRAPAADLTALFRWLSERTSRK